MFLGLKAAVKRALGKDTVSGLHIAMQGAGSVATGVALHAAAEGARLSIADVDAAKAQKLADAADIMSQNPATIQLRYLQTLLQIGVNNTTIVFPLPIELMDAFQRITGGEGKTIVPPPPPPPPPADPPAEPDQPR